MLERGGRRRDRVLAARPGPADRPLPGRHPRGLARARAATTSPSDMLSEENLARVRGAERDRRGARPDAGAAGDRLGAARRARHLGAARRQQRRAARAERRRAASGSTSTADELDEIDRYAVEGGINLWAPSSTRLSRARAGRETSARAAVVCPALDWSTILPEPCHVGLLRAPETVTVNVPRAAAAAGEHGLGLAVQSGGDLVLDHVRAGLDRGHAPVERRGLARASAARAPRCSRTR